jgi:GTP cyclohydrolase II
MGEVLALTGGAASRGGESGGQGSARVGEAGEAIRAVRRGNPILLVEDGGSPADQLIDHLELRPELVLRVRPGSRPATRQALALARALGLPVTTTRALSAAPRGRPQRVERVCEARLPLAAGSFTMIGYLDLLDGREHVALSMGELSGPRPLVHIHAECLAGDALQARSCACGSLLRSAIDRISTYGRGVIVYLRDERRGIDRLGGPAVHATELLDYDVAFQILDDLGVTAPRMLAGAVPDDEDLGFTVGGLAPLRH